LQDDVIIKIYTTQEGFRTEQLLYNTKGVAAAVGARPEFSDNKDCAAICPLTFFVFPPYSVSPSAVSLQSWLQVEPKPSLGTSLEVRLTRGLCLMRSSV
jgi:hypothetical protein